MLKLPRSTLSARDARAGLGRTESVWIIVLAVGVAFAILGSLSADRDARDLREARDELRYLAGQLSFALHATGDRGESWPHAMASAGSRPDSWEDKPSMAAVLGESAFLPSDADGRAYHLQRTGPRTWVLSAPLPDGEALDLEDEAAMEQARHDALALELRMP